MPPFRRTPIAASAIRGRTATLRAPRGVVIEAVVLVVVVLAVAAAVVGALRSGELPFIGQLQVAAGHSAGSYKGVPASGLQGSGLR